MKTVFRVLAGLISLGSFCALFIFLKFPVAGFEQFAPTIVGISGLFFAVYAASGKTGIHDVLGTIDLDKEIPPKTFWGGIPIWANLGLVVLVLILLGYLCLRVVK